MGECVEPNLLAYCCQGESFRFYANNYLQMINKAKQFQMVQQGVNNIQLTNFKESYVFNKAVVGVQEAGEGFRVDTSGEVVVHNIQQQIVGKVLFQKG